MQSGHAHIQHQIAGDPVAGQGQAGFARYDQVAATPGHDRHRCPFGISLGQWS